MSGGTRQRWSSGVHAEQTGCLAVNKQARSRLEVHVRTVVDWWYRGYTSGRLVVCIRTVVEQWAQQDK